MINITSIARICHQANKAYCESIGDYSQVDWEDAELQQRESAISGVTFRVNNPFAHANEQHEAWVRDKINDGWVYGPEKDVASKTHHCMVDYSNLPEEQQAKDMLFAGIVKSMLPLIA